MMQKEKFAVIAVRESTKQKFRDLKEYREIDDDVLMRLIKSYIRGGKQ